MQKRWSSSCKAELICGGLGVFYLLEDEFDRIITLVFCGGYE
jgi:hypothetical protein